MVKISDIISMKIMEKYIGSVLNLMGVEQETELYKILHFFFTDIIKISFILFVSVMIISFVQTYFNVEKSKKIMEKYNGMGSRIIGALLGTVTPFCSCHSIPIFMGFVSSGVSLGTTFSFLISSPMVDLASFVLLYSIFGIKTAILYIVFGLLIAVIGGTIIENMKLESEVNDFVYDLHHHDSETDNLSLKQRVFISLKKTVSSFKKVFPFIFIGVLVGSVIYNEIPDSFIVKTLGKSNSFSPLIATVIGIPIYGDIFGVISIGESLFKKGADIGVILSFMMAVTTLSLPSLIMLGRVVKIKLLIVFISICLIGIVFLGYLFGYIL